MSRFVERWLCHVSCIKGLSCLTAVGGVHEPHTRNSHGNLRISDRLVHCSASSSLILIKVKISYKPGNHSVKLPPHQPTPMDWEMKKKKRRQKKFWCAEAKLLCEMCVCLQSQANQQQMFEITSCGWNLTCQRAVLPYRPSLLPPLGG